MKPENETGARGPRSCDLTQCQISNRQENSRSGDNAQFDDARYRRKAKKLFRFARGIAFQEAPQQNWGWRESFHDRTPEQIRMARDESERRAKDTARETQARLFEQIAEMMTAKASGHG